MAENYQVYSAAIVLPKSEDWVSAIYVQEFFKFCGICTRVQETDAPDEQTFDWDKKIVISNDETKKIDGCSITRGQDNEKAVEKAARMLGEKVFTDLAQIFYSNHYAKVNYQVHCFLKQMNQQELFDAAQSYYDCFLKLRKLEKEMKQEQAESRQLRPVLYALLTCARKINILCRQRGNLLYFDVEKMCQEAAEFYESDPDFFMGDAVIAWIAAQDQKLWDQGMRAIEQAIQTGDSKKHYTSFLRYFYAHFLEEEKKDEEKARIEYKKILDRHDSYYRALYKEAYYLWKEQKYQLAREIFLKMTEPLEKKRKTGWIQPMEIEYLYKGCMFIKYIAEEQEKNESAIPAYVHDVIDRKNELFEQSRFVQSFWENNLKNEAKYFEKKLAKYHV